MIIKPVLSLALCLVLAVVAAYNSDQWLGLLELVLAITAGIGTIMWGIDWAAWQYGTLRRDIAQVERERAEASAITPWTRGLEYVSTMSLEQINFAKTHPQIMILRQLRIHPLSPRFVTEIAGRRFEFEDIELFVERSNPPYFCPIHEFSEGSRERTVLMDLTLALIGYGLLEEARGNRSAKAFDWDQLLISLGFESEGDANA